MHKRNIYNSRLGNLFDEMEEKMDEYPAAGDGSGESHIGQDSDLLVQNELWGKPRSREETVTPYYSLPQLGAEEENKRSNLLNLENDLTSRQTALQQMESDMKEDEALIAFLNNRLKYLAETYQLDRTETSRNAYNETLTQLQQAQQTARVHYLDYLREYDAYKTSHAQYQDSVQDYQKYMAQQQNQYQAWKATVRDSSTVQSELDAINQQIENQKKSDRNDLPILGQILDWSGIYQAPVSDELQALLDKKTLLEDELYWAISFPYMDYMEAEDWKQNSQYVSTQYGDSVLGTGIDQHGNAYGYVQDSGFGDLMYDYINKNQDAIAIQDNYNLLNNSVLFGTDGAERLQMTDDEIAIYNYVYATQGKDAAENYVGYLTSYLNERERYATQQEWAQAASENPFAASILSVLMTPAKGLSYIGQMADYMDDGKIDQNAGYNKYSYIPGAIRGSVSQSIEDAIDSNFWGKVGSFGYNTAMSMGDFLITTGITGGNSWLTLSIMGSGAAADTTISALDRGLTSNQAFALGTVAGIAEALTEKVSLAALMDLTKLSKGVAGYVLDNIWQEGAEEVTSSMINLLADIIISRDKSEWNQSIETYKAQGMTAGQAFGMAMGEQALSLGVDFLGGAISGGAMSGVSAGAYKMGGANQNYDHPATLGTSGVSTEADSVSAMDEISAPDLTGTFSDEIARQMIEKLDSESGPLTGRVRLEAPNVHVDTATWDMAQRLSTALNRDIIFYEAVDGKNGYCQNGVIHINVLGHDPLLQTFSHELTHSVEGAEIYAKLRDLVLGRMESQGLDLDIARQAKIDQYKKAGHPLKDAAAVDQELVAEYVSKNLLTNEQGIIALAKEQPGLCRRLWNWLKNQVAKLGGKGAREQAFVRQASALYAKALRQTAESVAAANGGMISPMDGSDTVSAPLEAAIETGADSETDPLSVLDGQLQAGEITDEEYDDIMDEYDRLQEERYSTSDRKYSISRTQDNKPFVTVESDILAGVPRSEWVRTVKENLKQKFPNGVTVGNQEIKINQQSRREMTYSKYMRTMVRANPEIYSDKLRATDHADEVLLASTDWVNEGLNHPRSDDIREFARGNVLMRVGSNDYSAEVIVGTKKDGSMLLYDIINLRPISISEKNQMRGNTASVPEGTSQQALAPDGDNISDRGPDVKQQYSLSEETVSMKDGANKVRWIDKKETSVSIPSADDRQRSRYQEPGMGGTQSEVYEKNVSENGPEVKRQYSLSGETVSKKDVAGDLRAILQRGGSAQELRQYVERLERSGGKTERKGVSTEQKTSEAERKGVSTEQKTSEAERILKNARRQGIGVEEYLQQNWEQYDRDGQWNKAARQALELEKQGGKRKYSLSDTRKTCESGYEGVSLSNDSRIYTYDFLSAQPDMDVVRLPEMSYIRDTAGKIDTGKVVEEGMKNALSVGTERDGKTYIRNKYSGRDIRVDVSAIRHGLNGKSNRLITNARLGSKIGEVVQNAIPINALHDTSANADGTYAMAGYAMDDSGREIVAVVTVEQRGGSVTGLETFDVTHAVSGRQKRSEQADTKSQGVYPIKLTSKIKITDLVQKVNSTYRSILSEDVLRAIGEARPADGHYTERVKFSVGETGETDAVEEKPDARSTMPKKAKLILETAESQLMGAVSSALRVPSIVSEKYLMPIVQELSDLYLEKGTLTEEDTGLLFDKFYATGVAACKDFLDQYAEVAEAVRSTALTPTKEEWASIFDTKAYKDFAKKYLRIVGSGGQTVADAFQKARSIQPDLFPGDMTTARGQAWRLGYVVQNAALASNRMEQIKTDSEAKFRESERNDFDNAVAGAMGELWKVKRFADEKAAKEKESAPMTAAEAMEVYGAMKKAWRTYEKVNAKNLLTEHDQMQVGKLLRHEMELSDLKPGVDNVEGITAVFEAKQEYEQQCKLIREYKQHLHGQLAKTADRMLETANSWKDKKVGILYARETMRRNILDIVPDKALAKEILDEYFEPVHTAEAQSTRFKTQMRDRVRKLSLSRKVTKGNLVSEAHAVQLLGEAEDNIRMLENARGRIKKRDGKTLEEWRATVQKLWEKNPKLDKAKIENAVQEFRKIYDELFQQMNKVRVANGYEPINYRSGYFPHFQPGDGDSILAQFGRALGIDTQVDALPTTINGLTHIFKPGIQWFGNAQERLGFNTAYDAVAGFDKYIEGAASVIHQTENIQKLRALARQIRYRTSDDGIREQVDAVNARMDLSQEEKQVQISAIYEKARFSLSNFVVELDEYTNLLANKKSRYDRAIEAAMGRRVYTFLKNLENRVAANMIAGNLTSALTNFIPLTQAGAQMDKLSLLKGMWETLRSYRVNDGIVEQSTFLTNRKGSDPLIRNWAEKTSQVLGRPMEFIDSFTSGAIVRGAYYQNIKRGMSEAEAMYQADIFASNVMADRSKGSMPTLMQATNPLMKAVTQFQLEVNNQFSEVFKDLPRGFKEKGLRALALVLLQYFLGAWLFNELYEKLIGHRPALDPIGIVCDAVDDVRSEGWGAAGTNFAMNVLEQLPFSSAFNIVGIEIDGGRIPVSSAFMDFQAIWEAATTEGWSAERRWKEIQDELNKLAYVLPPLFGNQASKFVKGVKAYIQGGSYTIEDVKIKDEDGNVIGVEGQPALQYPVYKDNAVDAFWNMIRAALLGKNSLQTAQDWVNSGFNSLGAKQTAVYQDMVDAGVSQKDAFALIQSLEDAQKTATESKETVQRQILQAAEISDEGKAIVYYGLLASEKEQGLMDLLADMGADAGAVALALMDMKDAGTKMFDKLSAISGAALTDEEKAVLVGSVLGTDLLTENGNLTQYAKFDYAIQNGMTVDEYIEYRLSGANIDRYLELRDLGVPVADAMAAGMALADLSDKVEDPSTIQKWRVVIDSTDDPEIQLISLSVVMTENQYAKVLTANNFGISPELYVQVNEQLVRFDADGNGSYTQAEVTKAISSMNMLSSMKAVLWQLITGAKSAKNNPFNTSMGQKVIEALAKAEAQQESTGRSFSDELMRQIMGG